MSSSVSFLPHFHPLCLSCPITWACAISMAFLLWYILRAIFPPSLSPSLKPSLNVGLSLWALRTNRHNFFYAHLLSCLVSPSGTLLSVSASLSSSPAPVLSRLPLTSPSLLLLGGFLACVPLQAGAPCVPCCWPHRPLDPHNFPSLVACLDPPPCNFPASALEFCFLVGLSSPLRSHSWPCFSGCEHLRHTDPLAVL